MGKVIDMSKWQDNYVSGRQGAGAKLAEKYAGRTGKLDALRSASAEANFKARVLSASALKKRARKLAALTEEQLNDGMRTKGAAAYANVTDLQKTKAANGFAPYAGAINAAVASLPPKTADGMANLTNRAGAVVKAELAKKAEIG